MAVGDRLAERRLAPVPAAVPVRLALVLGGGEQAVVLEVAAGVQEVDHALPGRQAVDLDELRDLAAEALAAALLEEVGGERVVRLADPVDDVHDPVGALDQGDAEAGDGEQVVGVQRDDGVEQEAVERLAEGAEPDLQVERALFTGVAAASGNGQGVRHGLPPRRSWRRRRARARGRGRCERPRAGPGLRRLRGPRTSLRQAGWRCEWRAVRR